MTLFTPDEIPVLKLASDVKTVSDSALTDAEEMAIAKLINSTANTGEYEALYNHPISETTIQTLEGKGYTVTKKSPVYSADPKTQYIISWRS